MNNPWCESCSSKNVCYTSITRPKCYTPITNTFDCRRCKHHFTEKCCECFGYELFEDAGYVTEQTHKVDLGNGFSITANTERSNK